MRFERGPSLWGCIGERRDRDALARGSFIVTCCERFPDSGVEKSRPLICLGAGVFFMLNRVVSSVVILLRFPVHGRGRIYNTDASEHRMIATVCCNSPE